VEDALAHESAGTDNAIAEVPSDHVNTADAAEAQPTVANDPAGQAEADGSEPP
jgi:hypothetical protein